MNPVFIFLVIIVAVILWFVLSFMFIPFGSFLKKRCQKMIDIAMQDDAESENKNNVKSEENEL